MKNAFLNEEDIKMLMKFNGIATPFFLIEASENTKVDYYVPNKKEDLLKKRNFLEESFQILVQSSHKLNFYIATERENVNK